MRRRHTPGLVLALTLGLRKMTFRNLVQRAVVGHALRADCSDAHAPQSADHRACAMRGRARWRARGCQLPGRCSCGVGVTNTEKYSL
jgi:hypothetical protein